MSHNNDLNLTELTSSRRLKFLSLFYLPTGKNYPISSDDVTTLKWNDMRPFINNNISFPIHNSSSNGKYIQKNRINSRNWSLPVISFEKFSFNSRGQEEDNYGARYESYSMSQNLCVI